MRSASNENENESSDDIELDDGPPWHSEDDFRVWHQRGFHPTARLDGRSQWLRIRNLRHTQNGRVVACPRDMAQFIELERLHHAVKTRTFYAPVADYGHTHYVSLIPGPVVDWFTRYALPEVHEQIVEYLVLRVVTGMSDAEGILRDSCQFYQPQIQALLTKYAQTLPPRVDLENLREEDFDEAYEAASEAREKAEHELLKDAATRLPPWLAPRARRLQNEHYDVTYWSLPDWYRPGLRQDFPWPRPGTPFYDDLGIVLYGITSTDEEGLVAAETWEAAEQKHRAARRAKATVKPLPPPPDSLTDELRRSESCRFAFEFLLYARHQGQSWARSSALLEKPTETKGRVYLVQDGQGRVKIGWTAEDPAKRLTALQTGNADALTLIGSIPGPQELEKRLHGMYAHCKVREDRTEWFALKPSDVIAILAMDA